MYILWLFRSSDSVHICEFLSSYGSPTTAGSVHAFMLAGIFWLASKSFCWRWSLTFLMFKGRFSSLDALFSIADVAPYVLAQGGHAKCFSRGLFFFAFLFSTGRGRFGLDPPCLRRFCFYICFDGPAQLVLVAYLGSGLGCSSRFSCACS